MDPSEITEFLGKPVGYWRVIKNLIETKGIDSYIDRLAQLEAENERLREVEQRNDLLEEIRGMRTDIQNVGIAIQNLHPRRGRVN